MKTILRNIFALLTGWTICAIVNMPFIVAGSKVFPNYIALDVMNAMG